MKMSRMMAMLVMALGLLLGQEARAFYNPQTGRWFSRDPLSEQGFQKLQLATQRTLHVNGDSGGMVSIFTTSDGKNDYVFVQNSPVNTVDYLGLWSLWPFCCSGVKYNPLTHCCCRGKVLARSLIDTGLKICQDSTSILGHTWIEMQGASAGFYHYGVQFPERPANVSGPKRCQSIFRSPCACDLQIFRERVAHIMLNRETPRPYDAPWFVCWDWTHWVVLEADGAAQRFCGKGYVRTP